MENYDLLSLFKYTPKATGCPDCADTTDGESENTSITDDNPQYNVVSGDTATLDGKEVDALGELSDEDVEEGIKAQGQGTKISDVGIYKTIGETLLDKLKKLILWIITGEKPAITEPETPIPENPEIGEDGTDGG